MSVRKASKREIQKEERRATASEPVLKPKLQDTSKERFPSFGAKRDEILLKALGVKPSKKGTLITKSEPPGPTTFPVAKSKKSKTGNHKKFSKSGFLM